MPLSTPVSTTAPVPGTALPRAPTPGSQASIPSSTGSAPAPSPVTASGPSPDVRPGPVAASTPIVRPGAPGAMAAKAGEGPRPVGAPHLAGAGPGPRAMGPGTMAQRGMQYPRPGMKRPQQAHHPQQHTVRAAQHVGVGQAGQAHAAHPRPVGAAAHQVMKRQSSRTGFSQTSPQMCALLDMIQASFTNSSRDLS